MDHPSFPAKALLPFRNVPTAEHVLTAQNALPCTLPPWLFWVLLGSANMSPPFESPVLTAQPGCTPGFAEEPGSWGLGALHEMRQAGALF